MSDEKGARCSSDTPAADGEMQPSESRPLKVVIDPSWSFDKEHCDPAEFFWEAKISEEAISVLQGRFEKYCSRDETNERCLTPTEWMRLNDHYRLCGTDRVEHFFRAMDRSGQGRLSWHDFLVGCSAANPVTPHILNSFTGYLRAQYIFEFYNVGRSGSLEFEELARLLVDTRKQSEIDQEDNLTFAKKVAQELGEVSVVTVRLNNMSGPLCDFRASTKWSGVRVRREIAAKLQVPTQGMELLIGERFFEEADILEQIVVAEDMPTVYMTMVRTNWELWPCNHEETFSDKIEGLERLTHVTFPRFYEALTSERLRGTSRLFRFQRQIFQTRSRTPAVGAPARTGGA